MCCSPRGRRIHPNRDTGFAYDGAGNVTADLLNQYLYDGEGRLCAVKNSATTATQYVYDAEGQRVAKGSLTSWPSSCGAAALGANGFALEAEYLLDPGGDQVTELNTNSGPIAWAHSNVWAAAHLDATYDTKGLHFHISDPLGSRRVQTSAAAGLVEETCQSLPFGDVISLLHSNVGPSHRRRRHRAPLYRQRTRYRIRK